MNTSSSIRIGAAYLLLLFGALAPSTVTAQTPEGKLSCATAPCAEVLPGAERFEEVKGAPYLIGRDETGDKVGWIVRSTDIVDIPAYSGKPLVTLVAIDPKGTIVGARVIHHSEPILLVGIPEQALHDFAALYVGQAATTRIVVGKTKDPNALAVDVISGATVTALAQNKTILDSARVMGAAVGVIDATAGTAGHFVERKEVWSWQQLLDEGVFGRLTVTEAEMNMPEPSGAFVDLFFTIADAPHIGRAILGDATYEHQMAALEPGQHLFIILGNGSGSFKGSGFVRGGIFDRVRFEQGLVELFFRDRDYKPLAHVRAVGAPRFKEAAVFISRGASIDPGQTFDLVFLGSRYTGKGFEREFRAFKSQHSLPESVYVTDKGASEAIYVQAWRNRQMQATVLGLYLLFVAGVFALRRWTARTMKRLHVLHYSSMLFGFIVVGIVMHTQPSVTQVLTFLGFVVHGGSWDLFATEPLIFMLWIFIALVSVTWGRGVFCGWVCPYGAMSELANKIAVKLRIPQFELPETVHRKLRYLRYGVLAILVPVFLVSSILGEQLAEIEPFKSTFYVPAWTREWWFLAWWLLLLGLTLISWRPFCRYLCPLGAGLALIGSFRFAGPYRRQFCNRCTICARGCEPKAIGKDGRIDPRECLSCLDCEANYNDPTTCPPLIAIERLKKKDNRTARDDERLERLHQDL